MASIQNGYSINSEPSAPKFVQAKISLRGIDRGKAEELRDKLKEPVERLVNEVLGEDADYSVAVEVVWSRATVPTLHRPPPSGQQWQLL